MYVAGHLLAPYLLQGGKTGCLLIHGFSGSPLNMRPLGEYLANHGYTVRGMVLPGHCTEPKSMVRYTWQDWLAAVEAEATALAKSCSHLWLIGFSMGGVLAGIAAGHLPVAGYVSIAAPIWPRARLTHWAFILKHFRRYVSMGSRREFELPSWRYDMAPVSSVDQLMRMIRTFRRELPQVKVPALVVQGDNDKTIMPKSASYIYENLGSRCKQIMWIPGGGHLLLVDKQRAEVCAGVERFIRNQMGGLEDD